MVVAAVLVIDGLGDVKAVRRTRGTARYNALVGGVASFLIGVLLLAWPDVSVLVFGALFGARMLITGAARSWRPTAATTSRSCERPRRGRSPGAAGSG